MNTPTRCDRCGDSLRESGVLGGKCPRCMLNLGLESAVGTLESTRDPTTASRLPSTGAEFGGHPVTIARYRILRLIGEGGMGSVYEAEQDLPRRIVALKIIKPGRATPELLRRFEHESHALGRLQHPGIAQIYEAGMADTGLGPQPYFAMEFIRGKKLTDYAEEHDLDTRQRMAMAAKIAEAVHHAHQRGLIHRDLKPANILVDETGQPKIVDFGVARITDSDMQNSTQTDMGQLVGTLAYMSPEQVLADPFELDTRSDVYSLGVTLYELLAGRLPYTIGKNLHENLHAIRESDPIKLSALNPAYRGDIETIVGKALEKDKTLRYASAAGLAEDLHRYLKDEPIAARPPSTTYQLRKFTRRHKALVTGVTAVFIVLVGGLIAFASMANLYQGERDHANNEAAGKDAVLEFMRIVVGQANPDAQGDSGQPNRPPKQTEPDPTLLSAFDSAVQQIPILFDGDLLLEATVREFAGDTYTGMGRYSDAKDQLESAMVRRRLEQGNTHPDTIRARSKLAAVYSNLKNYSKASELATQVALNERSTTGNVDEDLRRAVSTLVFVYSGTLENPDQAREFPKIARFLKDDFLEHQRSKSGEGSPIVLFAAAQLLSLYTDSNPPKYFEAATFMRQIADDRRRALGEDHPATLNAEKQVIGLYLMESRFAEAEAYLNTLVEAQWRTLGGHYPATMATINYLASVYLNQPHPRYVEAETFLKRVKESANYDLGSESSAVQNATIGLAKLYFKQARYAEAADLLIPLASDAAVKKAMENEVAIEIQPVTRDNLDRSQIYGKRLNTLDRWMEQLTMIERPTILDVLDLLDQTYLKRGNLVGANVISSKLRAILAADFNAERKTGPVDKNSVTAMRSMGAIAMRYIDQGRYPEAKYLLNTIVDDYRQLAAKDVNRPNSAILSATLISVFDRRRSGSNSTTQDVATLLTSVAISYSNKGMDLEAEELLKTILNINLEIMTESKWDTQRSLWRLASWYMDRAKYEEARAAYDRLTDIQTKFYGPGHTITRTTMLDIVGVYWDRTQIESAKGREDRRRLLLETNLHIRNRLLNVYRSEHGGGKSGAARMMISNIGSILAMLGRYPSAAEKFEEMIEIHETAVAVDVQAEAKPTAIANLGWTQFHQQKLLQAEATLRKALGGYKEIESDSWERYNTEGMLGATLVALRKFDEAEKLLKDSYEKLALRHPGPGPAQGFTAESEPGERIRKLYEDWGKTGKAAEWRQKMEETKLAGVK